MSELKDHKLGRDFYERPTLKVAEELIGKQVVYQHPNGRMAARIVEVEAYIGQDDPACHAARGKTPRNAIMFGPSGMAYIYFIYGMYHCLNFVTEREGFAAAVLLRSAEPTEGVELMAGNCANKKSATLPLLNGPGKFCRAFGLTRAQNGLDLTGNDLFIENGEYRPVRVVRSGRIGIKVGNELHWRFCESGSLLIKKRIEYVYILQR